MAGERNERSDREAVLDPVGEDRVDERDRAVVPTQVTAVDERLAGVLRGAGTELEQFGRRPERATAAGHDAEDVAFARLQRRVQPLAP